MVAGPLVSRPCVASARGLAGGVDPLRLCLAFTQDRLGSSAPQHLPRWQEWGPVLSRLHCPLTGTDRPGGNRGQGIHTQFSWLPFLLDLIADAGPPGVPVSQEVMV